MAPRLTSTLSRRLALFVVFSAATIKTSCELSVLGFNPSVFGSRVNCIGLRTHKNLQRLSRNRRFGSNLFYSGTLHLSKNNDDIGDEQGDKVDKNKKNVEKETTEMTPLDRAMKKARARVEIERLTTGAGALFDRESELKKIIGGISPGLEFDSPDTLTDLEYYNLETKLAKAIAKGDFESASEIREVMDRMHIDDCGYVLQCNSAFYKAFSDKDFEAMKDLWMHDNSIQCIHPSNPPVTGYTAIMHSWKQMFKEVGKDSNDSDVLMNSIEPTNIRLSVKGATAWLTCDEEVYKPKFVRGVGKTQELIKKMMATNIFRKVNGKWSIVHHHATLHVDSEKGSNKGKNKNSKSGIQTAKINLDGLGGEILGNPPSDSGDESNGVVKRVFMGSISDLLNGGLGDLLSDDGGPDDGDNNDGSGKTIIRVSSNFDGDEDHDDDHDDDDDSENGSTTSFKLSEVNGFSDSDEKSKQQQAAPKDALRQNCITALRKLANKGTISPKQKRLLLTDIITCSAKGEFSMVEVAYELLCGEGDDKDAAEEEFADQCRVFADEHKSNDYPSGRS